VMTPLLGLLIERQGVNEVLLGVAGVALLTGLVALSRPAMRAASFASRPPRAQSPVDPGHEPGQSLPGAG
jgi:hypothetical protein